MCLTVSIPPDAQTLVVQMPNVPVASDSKTSYRCIWFEPPYDKKYHIYSTTLVSGLGGDRRRKADDHEKTWTVILSVLLKPPDG